MMDVKFFFEVSSQHVFILQEIFYIDKKLKKTNYRLCLCYIA
jgi:hypothetical protein